MTLFAHPRQFAAALPRAWRSLRRRPGFFVIAVSSLAIALGLATTVIAELDSLVHPDLGTPYDDRLFVISGGGEVRTPITDSDLARALRGTGLVEEIATTRQARGTLSVGIAVGDASYNQVSSHLFDAAGMRPIVGRWFRADEAAESHVAIIGEDTWRRGFGAPATLESIRLQIDGQSYSVVGVADNTLSIPMFGSSSRRWSATVYVPHPRITTDSVARRLPIIYARAKPGIKRQQMMNALKPVAQRLSAEHGAATRPVALFPMELSFRGPLLGRIDGLHKAMIGAIAFIVIIACANVSALMLARSVARRREQALRLALGAPRSVLIYDVAAEVTIIAIAGGVAGLLVGDWSMRILTTFIPPDLPWLGFKAPHWRSSVFFALFGVVAVCIAIASLIPSLFVNRIAPVEQLKDESGTTTGRPRRAFTLLVIGELALSMILMFGSVLVARSADTVADFDFGYDARNVGRISVQTSVRENAPPTISVQRSRGNVFRRVEISPALLDDIVTRVKQLPEVRDAAWAFGEHQVQTVLSDATFARKGQLLNPTVYNVGAGFLATLGLPVIDGRDFTATDRQGNGAIILDELSAEQLFPDGKPVGKLVKFGFAKDEGPWMTVVGIARNARHSLPEDPAMQRTPTIYVSRPAVAGYWPNVVVRAKRGEADARPAAAAVLADLLPPNTIYESGKWVSRFDDFLLIRRFTAGLFLTLSFASLVLAAAGLFGVMSYAVNRRMREFAVRVALGATRPNVVRLVINDGLVMVLGGTAIGGAVAMYASFSMWQWLWGVYPVDAPALLISEGVLILVMMVGSILPALRATRANPVDIMRAN